MYISSNRCNECNISGKPSGLDHDRFPADYLMSVNIDRSTDCIPVARPDKRDNLNWTQTEDDCYLSIIPLHDLESNRYCDLVIMDIYRSRLHYLALKADA